jgi:hypothetical protein
MKDAPAVLKNFVRQSRRLFQHGVIPGPSQTKAKESALQEKDEASLMWASQRWRAAMEYYFGLDVSLRQTSICVVDQTGSVVREGLVDSDPEAISVYVRSKAPDAVRIGIETGSTSTWLWTELKRLHSTVLSQG